VLSPLSSHVYIGQVYFIANIFTLLFLLPQMVFTYARND